MQSPLPPAYRLYQPAGHAALQLAFPHDKNAPPQGFQGGAVADVAGDVVGELLLPEFDVAGRGGGLGAPCVPVPEAPVHEDGHLVAGQDDVRLAGQILAVQAEAEARGVQVTPHGHFGPGVAAPYAGHHAAARCAVDDIRHGRQMAPQRRMAFTMAFAMAVTTGTATELPNCR